MSLAPLLQTARPPFLLLTPVCLFLGATSAYVEQTQLEYGLLGVAFVSALLAHISVNMLNEYYDFRSGLDLTTNRTPFSGGSGALPSAPQSANAVLWLGLTTLFLSIALGLYLVQLRGSPLLGLGLLGVALVLLYTPWINRNGLACLVSPGLGFGVVMVIGTHYVLTGSFSSLNLIVASVPFFLANSLLLLNQFPDIEADRQAGRRHFPATHGPALSSRLYALLTIAAVAVIAASVISGSLTAWGLIALAPAPLLFIAWQGANRHAADIGEHPQFLAANVISTLAMPVLLGVSLLIGY